MCRLLELKEQYDNNEITSDVFICKLFEYFNDVGCFNGDDIKYIYELGRTHEKNMSDCTGETIKEVFIWSNKLDRNIKWD